MATIFSSNFWKSPSRFSDHQQFRPAAAAAAGALACVCVLLAENWPKIGRKLQLSQISNMSSADSTSTRRNSVVAAGKCNKSGCSKWTFGCGLQCKRHASSTNAFTLTKRVVQATPGKRTVRVLLISSNLPSTKVSPVPSTQAHLLIEFFS